jgi:hypothetical protein
MPPKKPTVESGGTRVTTRASNVDKHPGTEAKKTLQAQRDPEVIQAEKEKKRLAKEAKVEAQRVEAAQKEIAQQNLEECRARQATSLEHEEETFSQQRTKGKSTSLSLILSLQHRLIGGKKDAPSNSGTTRAIAKKPVGAVASNTPSQPTKPKTSSATPATVASSVRGQKRKSDVAPLDSDDEQPVTRGKKAKNNQSANPSNRPAPRPTSQLLKAQLAASESSSVSGVAVDTSEKQAATRKRPADSEVVALTTPVPEPPSKKVKRDLSANKPQPLRHTGSFFTSELKISR